MTPRIRKLYTFPIDDALALALKRLKERDGISEAEQIRRALRAWLEPKGVLPPTEPAATPEKATKRRPAGARRGK